MITIYAPNAQDFSTLGLGALAPYECTVEEQAGGMYELTMTHPMDAEGKWLNIGVGCIVKAPAPVRETPLVESEIVGEGEATEPVTVTRKIYKVQTNTGANLHLRQGPSTSTAILSKYRPGTEVVVLSQANGWGQVIVCSSGATGYMSMQYLVYVRDETETIEGDAPGPERVVYPVQSRMQLFRIFKVERDAAEREVRVEARHIFYDLLGNVVKNEYAPEGEAADAVVEELFARALNPHDFSVHCQTARSVTGEYTRRGLVECLLDPDDGVLPQTGARLVRDNFDVWLLPDATRETGVTIRHGKNLLGATLTTDWDSLVTRIIPVGQDKEGKALLLEGTTYMDSPHIGDYPVICAQAVEYDVKIGQEGIDNAAQARAKLQELAEADFSDNGVDLPTVGLDVDFVALGETEEYRAYADLEAVHLYDTVRVIAKSAGIDAAVRVTGYKWDALGRKYEAVTLGEIADLKTTVYGYELQRGSVKTIKIAPGAVDSAQLRELAVQYAHINTAAVEQLSANSITALKAYIAEIVAGSVTTDELYAGIASIALAQITTANIENANIDWAQIGTLSADIATIAKAHLTDADINWAQIANLTAAVAEIAEAKITGATIGSAQIDDLAAVVAQLIHAEVGTGEFDLAEIENLLASAFILEQGAANSMMIKNLVVTDANLLNATIGKLIMPGDDGKYYEVTIGSDGSISTSEVTVTDGEISAGQTDDGRQIVTTTINADSINGSNVTAQQAILGTILTTALTAGKITAGEALLSSAVIPTLYTTSIQSIGNSLTFESNEMIQSIVSDVNGNAEDLTNYISLTNSELENLQGQIDGAITTWFYAVPPTNDNPPANEWTTTDQKNIHLGDLYYDTITGYCYRWQVQNNQYSWQRITDTDVTKALQDAEKAQDTADSKRRVFVSQPVPPYEVGDLWVQGSTGDILRCKTAKTFQQSYSSSDWALASKYTDDTAADAAQATANANTTAIGSLNTRVTQAETSITQTQNEIELMASEIETELEDIRSDTEFATPYISATPPEEAPEAGKLWLDEGVEPSVLRSWRGADVTTEREYTETRIGCGKNLLDIAAFSPSHTTGVHVDVEANTLRVYTTDTGGTWRAANSKPFWVRRGITYNISATLSAYDGGYSTIVMRRVADHTSVDGSGIAFGGQTGRKVCKFTPTEDIYVYLSAFCTNDTITSGDCTYTQIQLEIGETATAFEPYEDIPFLALDNAQGQISQVEVEVGCDVTSKNMIDINSLTTTTNTSLSVSTDQMRVYTTGDGGTWRGGSTRDFVLRKGVSYTLSAELVEYVSGDAYVAIRNASDNKIIQALSLDFGTTPTTMSKTYTPDSNMTVYFTAFCSNDSVLTGDVTYREIQLEVGDEATAYEAYKGLAGKDKITITACGKNLIDPGDLYADNSKVEMNVSGDSVRVYTTGEGGRWLGARAPVFWIRKGVTCTLSATLEAYVSGNARLGLRNAGTGTFLSEATVIFGSTPGTLTKTFTPESDEEVYLSALCTNSTVFVGDCTFADIQLEVGNAATDYEPYHDMGGGTVTPTEPLYGLPRAEDTVEVSVDGDVLATHRTGVFIADGDQYAPYASTFATPEGVYAYTAPLTGSGAAHKENFAGMCSHFTVIPRNAVQSERVAGTVMLGILTSGDGPQAWFFTTQATAEAFNAWLQQQDSAGTPVTLVYELAAPETEVLTAISPIVPQPGQLNLTTDADALTATIHGSGWETVNDTSSIQDALANLDGDLASLINEVGLLNGEVGSIAQQIISPDGIKNIVFDSTEYQAMANTVEQNANELSVTQTTVTDINGRVETIEGTVRISGSNIDIGRSDSNVQLHLDNTGWSISEGGQETIYARQNRVVAPRFQTTSLIFGALAFNSSGGHFRLMKYGG